MEHAVESALERIRARAIRRMRAGQGDIAAQHIVLVLFHEVQLSFRTDQLVQIILRQVLILSSRPYGRQRI